MTYRAGPRTVGWRDWVLAVLLLALVALGVALVLSHEQVTANRDRIATQDALLAQTCLAGAGGPTSAAYHRQPVTVSTPTGPVALIACVRNG